VSLILLSALVTFIYVGLRAFQQLNVVNKNYLAVMPTSVLMSVGDVAIVMLIVKADTLWMGVSNGLAGGLGCWLAMYVSHKLFGGKKHGNRAAGDD